MMDPEMIRLAQEQMSRMSPAELSRIQQQMMSNPELMKMASDSMKNMKPEDLRRAAEQLKSIQPDQMAEIGAKMANATPDEIDAMRSRVDAQINYQLNAAHMLKQKGNELHSQGMFNEALEKYLRAKNNLKDIRSSKVENLLLACSLNLMSCYLKTSQFDECIKEGIEILATDARNVKALYRRGQAYKSLGQLENAVSDLTKALEFSPDDETIADVLRDAKEKLIELSGNDIQGLKIEDINNEVPVPLSAIHETSSSESSFQKTEEINNPLNSSNPGLDMPGVTPDMLRSATDMMNNIPAEELQNMFKPSSSTDDGLQSDKSKLNTSSDFQERCENSNSRNISPQSSNPASSFDMHEQIKNQLNNPAIREMMSSMMKNMSPDMMSNMSEQFGYKLSREDAERAQQAMSSLSPDSIDKMMKWASRIQGISEGAKHTKNWLLGRNGLVMAVTMLLLAVFLHWLGYFGH